MRETSRSQTLVLHISKQPLLLTHSSCLSSQTPSITLNHSTEDKRIMLFFLRVSCEKKGSSMNLFLFFSHKQNCDAGTQSNSL